MRLGIDFGGTNVKFGLFNEDGSTHKFIVRKLSELMNGKGLLENFLDETKHFINGQKLRSGGLSIKGLIDRQTGRLLEDVGAADAFRGVNLREAFGARLNIPFAVDNDARSYAMGEWKFGAGRNLNSVIIMTLGTGVGCAAIINGKLFSSDSPVSGVLGGHLSIDRNGPDCPCGNKGCLELYCSASALEREVSNKFPELQNSENTLKAFFESSVNNTAYKTVLNKFQEDLAIGIVNVIHAYGVDKVILGGGMMKSHEKILPELIPMVRKRAWTIPRGAVEILPAELGDKAACMGAAFTDF